MEVEKNRLSLRCISPSSDEQILNLVGKQAGKIGPDLI